MKHSWLALGLFVLGLVVLTGLVPAQTPPAPVKAPVIAKVSGPYTHANLTLFLLHGAETLPNRKFLTLQEAIEQKKVVVNETGSVNQLTVENKDGSVELFIMTGDIVKGGRQDRVLAFDLILPPKSGAVPLPSFCVESGRWSKRGGEDDGVFNGSMNQAAGNDLKKAINYARSQQEVWKNVAENQARLNRNVGKVVQNAASPTSFQLALEDKDLLAHVQAYEKDFVELLKKHPDAIGVAIAVNGKISGAELFGSTELFGKLWSKLLRSAATEALADLQKDKKFDGVSVEQVTAFLTAAMTAEQKEEEFASAANQNRGNQQVQSRRGGQAGQAPQQAVNPPNQAQQTRAQNPGGGDQLAANASNAPPKVRIFRYDGPKALVVECQDRDQPGLVVHRCFIAK